MVSKSGETEYDKLLIATAWRRSSSPSRASDLRPGVIAFRDVDDVNRMVDAAGTPGARGGGDRR